MLKLSRELEEGCLPPSSRRKFQVLKNGSIRLRGAKQKENGRARKRAAKWMQKKLRDIEAARSPSQMKNLDESIRQDYLHYEERRLRERTFDDVLKAKAKMRRSREDLVAAVAPGFIGAIAEQENLTFTELDLHQICFERFIPRGMASLIVDMLNKLEQVKEGSARVREDIKQINLKLTTPRKK